MTAPTVQELDAARADLIAARATFWRLATRLLDGHPRGTLLGDACRALPEPQRAAALALLAAFDGPDERRIDATVRRTQRRRSRLTGLPAEDDTPGPDGGPADTAGPSGGS
jgi:hypothetical protein